MPDWTLPFRRTDRDKWMHGETPEIAQALLACIGEDVRIYVPLGMADVANGWTMGNLRSDVARALAEQNGEEMSVGESSMFYLGSSGKYKFRSHRVKEEVKPQHFELVGQEFWIEYR